MPTKKKETSSSKPKKVVAVKAVAKKPVVKKAGGNCSKKMCGCKKTCSEGEAFWINNGPIVRSLEDLTQALKNMSDEQYMYHTKRDGNDFVRWIQDCFADTDCAKRLKQAKSRAGALRILSNKCACC